MATATRSFVELTGTAKLDRRTKDLVKRLGPGDVAIVDHADLDRVSVEELVESGVPVVVNVAPSQTGRFPDPGPPQLLRGGARSQRASTSRRCGRASATGMPWWSGAAPATSAHWRACGCPWAGSNQGGS